MPPEKTFTISIQRSTYECNGCKTSPACLLVVLTSNLPPTNCPLGGGTAEWKPFTSESDESPDEEVV